MSEKYPYKCCRCGYCCMVESCPAAMYVFKVSKHDPCPAFELYGSIAHCMIWPMVKGIGEGCCIKARAYKGGVEYDFAALPDGQKIMAAKDFIKRLKAGK